MARRTRRYVMISTVAERFDIHPQTLRLYEREGLLTPVRSKGNTRLYDEASIDRLQTILTLTRDMGVNLAGVEVFLRLQQKLDEQRARIDALEARLEDRQESHGRVRRHFALVELEAGPLVKS